MTLDSRARSAAAPLMPEASERVRSLVASMTLDEKLAQIVGYWADQKGESVAPLQNANAPATDLDGAMVHGLGHLTRVYGTVPLDPDDAARQLWERQRRLVTSTRLGIPALVHEECLTGLSAWQATTYPAPPSWGAAFSPELVERMGAQIGATMSALGIHQGLAPVLDVVRDPRWGRTEECIGEDPYLVGLTATSYVRGLQSAGVDATLKHFLGYSGSTSGRNFGPVSAGPREIADVFAVPFEMAVKDGRVASVMNAYTEIDGVPVVESEELLTGLLRDEWGFNGVVVADYYAVAFASSLHRTSATLADAAAQALRAGIDVELPTGDAYLQPLREALASGDLDESYVDRAVTRALIQKERHGLLDAAFDEEPPRGVEMDGPESRALARELAERSVVLVSNTGALPLAPNAALAVVGPNADLRSALFGCYSFANHVLSQHPDVPFGLEAPTVLESLRDAHPGSVSSAHGCDVDTHDTSGFAEAIALAEAADAVVAVVGDKSGLFGRGTSGEGCDADSLELPGVQRAFVESLLATGTPVVLVVVSGRPYVLDWAIDRCAAVVQSFFPGEEGGRAIAGVLTGEVNPSGRLPVTLPRSSGNQPYTYLHGPLGEDTEVTSVSSVPVAEFGHGLSYTTFAYGRLEAPAQVRAGDDVVVTVEVTNTGDRHGAEVVQLYGRDLQAQVTRPVAQLLGFARVDLDPGETRTVELAVPAARLAYSGRDMARIVEPGDLELWVGTSRRRLSETTTALTGAVWRLPQDAERITSTRISTAVGSEAG